MAEIIPAILPKSYDELVEKIGLAAGYAPVIQIDVCDGGYVPNRTWPYLKGTAPESDQIFSAIVSQESAFPHWEETDFEFDLMVRGAFEKIPDFISAGASRIIVHKGSVSDAELSSILKDYGKESEELGPFGVALGIALMPGDSPEAIKDIVSRVHFVQVMGIEKIGYQGQAMSQRAVELVRALKATYPGLPVSVDGGVNQETAPLLIEAGADRLVVGSALFGADDFIGTLEEFKAL
ncbi:MAG: hypothetical protein HZA81_00030 [Candidatus Taylorbacteria bacterium]|nr:hypothetical protein [Candidatus Taylorbacteria bacterium]